MTRRVVIGKRLDGSYGLSVSLAGVDAYAGDYTGGGFSFDDRWTDIVKVAMVGTVNAPGGSFSTYPTPVVSHGLGYVPFIEARLLSGTNVLNDDNMQISSFAAQRFAGMPVFVDTSNLTFQAQVSGPESGGFFPCIAYNAVYVVYAIPVPNPS